jgi:hypothetical protein
MRVGPKQTGKNRNFLLAWLCHMSPLLWSPDNYREGEAKPVKTRNDTKTLYGILAKALSEKPPPKPELFLEREPEIHLLTEIILIMAQTFIILPVQTE